MSCNFLGLKVPSLHNALKNFTTQLWISIPRLGLPSIVFHLDVKQMKWNTLYFNRQSLFQEFPLPNKSFYLVKIVTEMFSTLNAFSRHSFLVYLWLTSGRASARTWSSYSRYQREWNLLTELETNFLYTLVALTRNIHYKWELMPNMAHCAVFIELRSKTSQTQATNTRHKVGNF